MQYQIIGEPLPVVQCNLQPGEVMKTERGSMTWMSSNMKMSTNAGGFGKAISRMIQGEAIFQNLYTAENGPGMITFGSSFAGSIRALEISPGKSVICQKSAFLASELGVESSIHFQKKLGAGFFGGEGFIMQMLSGQGLAFIEIDGFGVEYELAPGESMILDTGSLAMMEESCSLSVEMTKGLKNMAFGGEGIFNTRVTGPGKILLQTMSVGKFAESLVPFLGLSKK